MNYFKQYTDFAHIPYRILEIADECWDMYRDGTLTQAGEGGDLMASGWMVSNEFNKKIRQMGYDEEKYKDMAETLMNSVDDHNEYLYDKYYEPSETNEEDE